MTHHYANVFYFAKSALKLHRFSDDQEKVDTIKTTLFRPKFKTQTSNLNDTVSGQSLKYKTQATEGTVREQIKPHEATVNPNLSNLNFSSLD